MISEMIVRQLDGYAMCVVAGLAAGAAAGVLNLLLSALKKHRTAVWLCDICIWLALGAVVIALTYVCSDGDLRLYIFFGFFSGFLLTFFTINWVALKIVNYILCFKRKDSKNVTGAVEKSR